MAYVKTCPSKLPTSHSSSPLYSTALYYANNNWKLLGNRACYIGEDLWEMFNFDGGHVFHLLTSLNGASSRTTDGIWTYNVYAGFICQCHLTLACREFLVDIYAKLKKEGSVKSSFILILCRWPQFPPSPMRSPFGRHFNSVTRSVVGACIFSKENRNFDPGRVSDIQDSMHGQHFAHRNVFSSIFYHSKVS